MFLNYYHFLFIVISNINDLFIFSKGGGGKRGLKHTLAEVVNKKYMLFHTFKNTCFYNIFNRF